MLVQQQRTAKLLHNSIKNLNAYVGLGVVLFRQKDYNGALQIYQQMLNLDPENALVPMDLVGYIVATTRANRGST